MSSNAPSGPRDTTELLSREELQSIIEFLAHDLLEGRAPGTRGGRLSELYLQSLFKLLGFRPGIDGAYLQPFRMKGYTSRNVMVGVPGLELGSPDDVMGVQVRDVSGFSVEGEAVFAGFGIRTSLFGWDDFKSHDVRGKVLIVRANDPGHYDPSLFEGPALTYFGRWSYKIEEARRAGARAILIVHTDESAGYDWGVVERSWGRENVFLPSSLENELEFQGWIREESFRRLLATKGLSLDELYRDTLKGTFEPVPLGMSIRIRGENEFRTLEASNVVAEIPGRSARRIVLSAHIDHIGHRPDEPGDNVFNGAIDNGSAVAALVLAAKALNAFREELPYTITVLACTAEEGGLLGSYHYVQNTDRSELVANVNFESTPVWERSRSVMGVGARYSTLEDHLKEIAAEEGLRYSEFSRTDQGFFYRSDQFPFARHGIPAVWISAGEDFESGRDHLGEFLRNTYHTVRDDFDPSWELEALRQTVRCAVMLVERIGRSPEPPRWTTRLPFPTGTRRIADGP